VWVFTKNLNSVIAVLVVSFPAPSFWPAHGHGGRPVAAARLGILIKNVGDIELAARINAFIFDKTGTLTTGDLARQPTRPAGRDVHRRSCFRIAASAEKYSNHPTAKALGKLAEEAGVPLTEPKQFAETSGRGIKARWTALTSWSARAQWLKDNGIREDLLKTAGPERTEGFSLIFVAATDRAWAGLVCRTPFDPRLGNRWRPC